MICCDQVGVQQGQTQILSQVSFELCRGEFIGIVGPNGAGKSTLLKALSGDLKIHHGHVTMDGIPLQKLSITEQAKKRAVLEQEFQRSFAYTVDELVAMGQFSCQNMNSQMRQENRREAMAAFGVLKFAHRKATTLSGGELQRVHMARVLTQAFSFSENGGFIFLDEPTSNLDVQFQFQSLEVFSKLKDRGFGVIAVLHDLNLAAQFSDRLLLLDQGQVKAMGRPSDVLTKEILYEVYNLEAKIWASPELKFPYVFFERKILIKG